MSAPGPTARATLAGALAALAATAALPLLGAAGCSEAPELVLKIRVPPDDQGLFQAVTQLNLTATRDDVVLAQRSFPASTASVSLVGVTHGPRTVVALEGVDSNNQIVAYGQTCPLTFDGPGTVAPLYFAPTNFFGPTAPPPVDRYHPVGGALSDGSVLIVGGNDENAAALASADLFLPGAATFEAAPGQAAARKRAASTGLPGIGQLIVGGLDDADTPVAAAELFLQAQRRFVTITDPRLVGRVGHQVVTLPDGRALVTGGVAGGAPLAATLYIAVMDDGTYRISAGPLLAEARSGHAATVAIGTPIMFGGYDASGVPRDSIEAISVSYLSSEVIARMRTARAEPTASVLADGSILLVGGIGPDGQPLADAELFNPITRTTEVYPLAFPRHGHSATVLADGRVMIAGGSIDGAAIRDVELFVVGVGFLSERSLGTPRAGHLAVPLCDETVLLTGGGAGAELYSRAPR